MRYFHVIAAIFFAVVSSVSGLFPYKAPPISNLVKVNAPTVTPTVTPTLTPTAIPYTPTPLFSPTPSATPTTDPVLVSSCATATLHLEDFSGHDCLSDDENMRWVFGPVNGKQVTQSFMDTDMIGIGGDGIKNTLLSQCYKSNKEHFERCNSSIHDNAERFLSELAKRYDGDIKGCWHNVSAGDDFAKSIDQRYLMKKRMGDAMGGLYDFCYSHGDSVADYHF